MKDPIPSRMFWFVWNEHRSLPRYKHFTEQEAKAEARRLALQSPGEEFHVLALVCSCAHQAVVWRSPTADDPTIPF